MGTYLSFPACYAEQPSFFPIRESLRKPRIRFRNTGVEEKQIPRWLATCRAARPAESSGAFVALCNPGGEAEEVERGSRSP